LETLSPADARSRLSALSSQLFDAAKMQGGKEGYWSFGPSNCNDSNGNAIRGLYQMRHVWNWDDLDLTQLNAAVERVHTLLAGWPGWNASNLRYTADDHSAMLIAYGPDNSYWVDVEAVPQYGRVTFSVSLPCTKVPKGERDPIFDDVVK
jgi:hypothetical protein